MNRARQDSTTTEIMEIVGGAEALRGSDGGHHTEHSRETHFIVSQEARSTA